MMQPSANILRGDAEHESATPSLFPQWPLAQPEGPPPLRTRWVSEMPLCFVGGWEPLSFRKRTGYAWSDEDTAYTQEFSDKALEGYCRLGATSIVIPYAKGFGRRATQHEIEQAREITARAHAKGLRVGVYVRVDALVPETVRVEQPNVTRWLMRGMYGRPSVYSAQQSWRKRVCYSHPEAVSHLEATLEYVVRNIGVDQLHLDGYHIACDLASACRCEQCMLGYRRWLERHYPTPEAIESQFGVLHIDELEIPLFEPGQPLPVVINSPDIRAWLCFQWDRELAFTRHMRRFIRGLSAEVAISINPYLGVYSNAPLQHAQFAQRLLPWVDLVWSEDPFYLRILEDRPISRLASFKLAREAGLPVCAYHWAQQPERIKASIALSISANGGHPSCLGFTFRYLPHAQLGAEAKTQLTRWVQAQWPLLGNTRPVGEVGLVRHAPSLTWNGRQPWEAVATLEALLTKIRIAWRLLDRLDHPALDEVRTLLLAEAECLSDAELERLRAWVEAGGRLLFTTRTGRYNGERRRRPRHPILDWVDAWRPINDSLGPEDWFAWLHEDVSGLKDLEIEIARSKVKPAIADVGAGRLGWWPAIRSIEPMTPHTIRPRNLRPPLDAEALEHFLVMLHGPFSMRVEAPPQVMVEFNRPAVGDGRLVHLVRIDDSESPVEATIHLEAPITAERVSCLSPDQQPPRLSVQSQALRLRGLQRYAVLQILEPHG